MTITPKHVQAVCAAIVAAIAIASAAVALTSDRAEVVAQAQLGAEHAHDDDAHWTPERHREMGRLIERLEAAIHKLEKMEGGG